MSGDQFPSTQTRLDEQATSPLLPGDRGGDFELLDPQALRYRILRPHAKGGLGEVFVARDAELKREVALKAMLPHVAANASSRARFLLEAEITGGLEHPGIVPVYGLGRYPDGRPYYAMRFIAGGTLHEAAQAYHRGAFASEGERNLAFRGLLRRFGDACNAVAYAHSRGILHRDLKPANIMLGSFGETLVVDWGLAKRVGQAADEHDSTQEDTAPIPADPSAATRAGSVLGTLPYMSPEQAAGEIDQLGPPSDVYSLGATLYALLVGKPPFAGMPQEIRERVIVGDFAAPRVVRRETPAALDAIVRKAMALRPADRYADALALAADVEQYLADEPVSAYREPWSVRLRRWTRRHRTLVAGLGVLLCSAVLALSLGLFAVDAERQRTDRARRDAVLARNRARDALDAMTSELAGSQLTDQTALTPEQKQFLERVLGYYQEFALDAGNDRDARERTASAAVRVGWIETRLGRNAQARQANERAMAGYSQLAADYPDEPSYLEQWALCLFRAAEDYRLIGSFDRAIESARCALELNEQLVHRYPNAPEYRFHLARTLDNLAMYLKHTRQTAEAERCFRRALELHEALLASNSNSILHRRELATALGNYGTLLADRREKLEAEKLFRRALLLAEQSLAERPDSAEDVEYVAQAQYNLGVLLATQNQSEAAELAYRRSMELHERQVAAHPSVPVYRRRLADDWYTLGDLYGDREQPEEAQRWYERAAALGEKLVAEFPEVAAHRLDLGKAYCAISALHVGEPQRLIEWASRGLSCLEPLLDNPGSEIDVKFEACCAYIDRGAAREALGQYAAALADFERAVHLCPPSERHDLTERIERCRKQLAKE